jgi:hypothetical protein
LKKQKSAKINVHHKVRRRVAKLFARDAQRSYAALLARQLFHKSRMSERLPNDQPINLRDDSRGLCGSIWFAIVAVL